MNVNMKANRMAVAAADIIFTPDGNARCLYTEAIDLAGIGRLSMRRATTIEYDNVRQHWVVRNPDGIELFSNPSRQTCLGWERTHLEAEETQKHETQPEEEKHEPAKSATTEH